MVLSNSFSGRGLAPRVGIKLAAGVADGAVSLPNQSGGKFIVKKTAFSGKAFALVELTSANKVIALTPNSYKIVETTKTALVEEFSVETNESDFKAMLKEIVRSTDKVSLPDAEIIVSGGRGLKGPENWGMVVEELADLVWARPFSMLKTGDQTPAGGHIANTLGQPVLQSVQICILQSEFRGPYSTWRA